MEHMHIPDDIKLTSRFLDVLPRNHTLPFEVLGIIFRHIPMRSPLDLRPILFVCNSWHEAVCRHSSLWSDIKLDYAIYQMFSVGGTFQESLASNYLRCCLKYSGTMPLDITLNFDRLTGLSFGGDSYLETRILPLLEVLVGQDEEHLVRWRSFTWYAVCLESVPNTLSFLPSTIPNLQTVNFYEVVDQDGLFPTCPNLQTVGLHLRKQFILRDIDCSHVTKLEIGTEDIWNDDDVWDLSKFINVRWLALYTVGYPWSIEPPIDLSMELLFPYLHSLRLRGLTGLELVHLLNTPRLKELEFDEVSLFNLLKDASLASTIETAHIRIHQRYSIDLEVSISEKVMGLLTAAPLLQRLRIPKWLHEELESGGLSLEERRVHLEVVPE